MSQAVQPPAAGYQRRPHRNARILRIFDGITYGSALGGALLMIGFLVVLLIVIYRGAKPAMDHFGWSFLWTSMWRPNKEEFGALPVIFGTLVSALIAMAISLPISLGSAVFLVKLAPKFRFPIPRKGKLVWYSPRHFVTVASFMIELLAAIPSIAYGFWGVFFLIPFMQNYGQPFLQKALGWMPFIGQVFQDSGRGANLLTAGIILAIMVTPIMTAIIRDVVAVAPPELEQGALGLGATWWQATSLVLGYSKMGIFGAVILGFARAIGETMAVTMVIGNSMKIGESLTASGQTIAGLLANQFREADTEMLTHALIYTAFVLLVITTLINGFARALIMRTTMKKRRN